MKRAIVICEGPTEKEFCEQVLAPYLYPSGIEMVAPLIKRSGGGITPWPGLKNQIRNHLRESGAIVTTLIDYYGIKDNHLFPCWSESYKFPDKAERLDFLENAMKEDIEDAVRYRFIPYLQLHEFEALLFIDIDAFYEWIPKNEFRDEDALKQVFSSYPNPEMINDNKETSPSHRLKELIAGYDKVLNGPIIAEEIGIDRIRERAPRFNQWIEKIIASAA